MDVVIAPSYSKKLLKVTLPRPKDGEPQQFLYDEDNLCLHEIVQYKDEFRSWFIGNDLCTQGHYKMLTRVDPLFLLLPQIIKYAKDQFRPIGDICQDYEQARTNKSDGNSSKLTGKSRTESDSTTYDRIDYALEPNLRWEHICDVKQIDDELFIRFSESNTLGWLSKKHDHLMESLEAELSDSTSKATKISYAMDLLDEYVPDCLSQKYKDTIKSKQYVRVDEIQQRTQSKKSQSATSSQVPPPKRAAASSSAQPVTKPKPPANSISRFFVKK